MDIFTKAQRSSIMSKIRGKNTKPELKIRKLMNSLGFTYQPKGIFGRPDYANKDTKTAVFVDGCFWHGCQKHGMVPATNRTFWKNKLQMNRKRDWKVTAELRKQGWKVIRLWECDLK